MKFNKFIIVCIFLLAILSLGAVCAADVNETSDSIAADDSAADVLEDPVINESNIIDKEDPSLEVLVPDEVVAHIDDVEEGSMEVILPEDVQGSTSVYFDGVFYEDFLDDTFEIPLTKLNLTYGVHTWKVEFEGDDFYNPASKEGSFNYSYISIDFPEIESGDDLSLTIKLPEGASGVVSVYIDGKRKYYHKYIDDDGEMAILISISDLPYEVHTYEVRYTGDARFPDYSTQGTFEYTYVFELNYDESISAGDDTSIKLTLPEDVTGNLDIIVDGKLYPFKAQEFINLDLKQLKLGLHNVTVNYYNGNYIETSKRFTIDVEGEFLYTETVSYENQGNVSLKLNNDAKGSLVVKIANKTVGTAKLVNGEASLILPVLDLGYNEVLFEYTGTDYTVNPCTALIYVTPRVVIPYDMIIGSEAYIIFELPDDAYGDFLMTLDGVAVDVPLINGKAIYAVDYLEESEGYGYNVDIYYAGGNYPDYEGSFNFEVFKEIPKITYSAPKTIYISKDTNFVFYLPDDAIGEMSVQVISGDDEDGEIFYGEIDEGEAIVEVCIDEPGTYTAIYYFEGDELYHEFEGTFNFTVVLKPRIEASNLVMVCSDGSSFSVRVYDAYGKVAKSTKVVFKINGKKFKTVTTDRKGYASIKFNKAPGSYKITVEALGIKVNKKAKVQHVLSLNTVSVNKKTTKKIVLTATLKKIKGKYLKKKNVKFTFGKNGKYSYVVKTNKKGVAKLTIDDKNILKNIKDMKYFKYSASYSKDNVVKSVKVTKK